MENNKSVLFLILQNFDPNSGGVQMSTFKLASYYNSRGLKVSIFSFSIDGHNPPEFVHFAHAKLKGLQSKAENIDACIKLAHHVKPDIVINQMPYDIKGTVLARLKNEINPLLLGCLRGSFFAVKKNLETYRKTLLPGPVQPFFNNKLGYWLLLQIHKIKHGHDLKRILDEHDYYVLFGEPNRLEIEYFIGKYKDEKLAFIPNSIPMVLEEVPKKEKRLLWLSRVDYRQKHAELIIPLWKLLKDRLPDWEFDLVGDGGALKDVKDQAQKENIDRFNIYGKQKPDDFYSRSPIYLMTSSFEGFPNTLIESQSFGCIPIVFDSYPMIREIVSNQNAILVETFNIDQMADEIVKLVNSNEIQKNLMDNALVNARRFTIEKVGEKWIELFEKSEK